MNSTEDKTNWNRNESTALGRPVPTGEGGGGEEES